MVPTWNLSPQTREWYYPHGDAANHQNYREGEARQTLASEKLWPFQKFEWQYTRTRGYRHYEEREGVEKSAVISLVEEFREGMYITDREIVSWKLRIDRILQAIVVWKNSDWPLSPLFPCSGAIIGFLCLAERKSGRTCSFDWIRKVHLIFRTVTGIFFRMLRFFRSGFWGWMTCDAMFIVCSNFS